jgi:hypothetical protein
MWGVCGIEDKIQIVSTKSKMLTHVKISQAVGVKSYQLDVTTLNRDFSTFIDRCFHEKLVSCYTQPTSICTWTDIWMYSQWIVYVLDDRGTAVQFMAIPADFSIIQSVCACTVAHTSSYLRDNSWIFPRVKAAQAWKCPQSNSEVSNM